MGANIGEYSFSKRFKGFLGLLGILTLVSLIVMNAYTVIMEPEEAQNILRVQKQLADRPNGPASFFPNTSQFLIYSAFGFDLFWLRLSNVVVFLLLLLGVRIWGAKLFGVRQIVTFMIMMVSSYLLISMSKFAVADIPLCAFHTMSFFFLIIVLKQPKIKWQIVYGLFVMGSFLVQPTAAVVYGVGLLFYMMIFHPKGKQLAQPLVFGVWLFWGVLFYWLGGFSWNLDGTIFSYQSSWGEFFIWQIVGLLPWLGFLPAALWELFVKLRKREEMAIILFGWLIFSVFSHAIILQMCLLFLMARQVEGYFKPNYPYKNLVKSGTIINLIFTFFVLLFVMLGGYAVYASFGFRSTVVFAALYWAFGTLGVIGLFGDSRRMLIGGMALGGAFSLLLFWIQINPIINQFREFDSVLLSKVGEVEELVTSEALSSTKRLRVNTNAKGINLQSFVRPIPDADAYILQQDDFDLYKAQNPGVQVDDTLMGNIPFWKEAQPYYIIKK